MKQYNDYNNIIIFLSLSLLCAAFALFTLKQLICKLH